MLPEPSTKEFYLNPNELDIVTTRGGGHGGQNVNKVETCVVITHIPTKTVVRCQTERSQHQNREIAMQTVRARVWQIMEDRAHRNLSKARNDQIGSGMRGDKRRTIQVQNNIVKDQDGRKWNYQSYRAGKWSV